MSKNTQGGKGFKKQKKRREPVKPRNTTNVNVDDGDGYFGTVCSLLGGKQLSVKLNDGSQETVLIPGRLYKRAWIKLGTLVLITRDKSEIIRIIRDNDDLSMQAHAVMDKIEEVKSIFGDVCEEEEESDENDIINNILIKKETTVYVKNEIDIDIDVI